MCGATRVASALALQAQPDRRGGRGAALRDPRAGRAGHGRSLRNGGTLPTPRAPRPGKGVPGACAGRTPRAGRTRYGQVAESILTVSTFTRLTGRFFVFSTFIRGAGGSPGSTGRSVLASASLPRASTSTLF